MESLTSKYCLKEGVVANSMKSWGAGYAVIKCATQLTFQKGADITGGHTDGY